MMRSIHYFVRNPARPGQVIYPIEIEDDNLYYGYGSFFMMGNGEIDIDEEYIFPAIIEGEITNPILKRVGSGSVYEAEIDGVGVFRFKATKIGGLSRYAGSYNSGDGVLAIRQLAPISASALDDAARTRDFYFIGFSPRLKI